VVHIVISITEHCALESERAFQKFFRAAKEFALQDVDTMATRVTLPRVAEFTPHLAARERK
jgi:hypothetical protein